MSNIPSSAFDDAVARFFEPLAHRSNLPIQKLFDGIYEIAGQSFAMRIRRGIGHRKGILVTLLPTRDRYYDDLENIRGELGLGNFVEFNNEQLTESGIDTPEGYLQEAEKLAKSAERFLVPYLLGTRSDFIEVKEHVRKRGEEALREVKKYQFPRNVREEWL